MMFSLGYWIFLPFRYLFHYWYMALSRKDEGEKEKGKGGEVLLIITFSKIGFLFPFSPNHQQPPHQ